MNSLDAQFDRNFARLLLEICRYTYAVPFRIFHEQNDAVEWINKQAVKPISHVVLTDSKTFSTSVASVFCYEDKNIVAYMGTKTEFDNIKCNDLQT